ncbi:hypothetical protein ABK040_004926 [Willaertia magna]
MEFFMPGRIALFGEHSDWASISPYNIERLKNYNNNGIGKAIICTTNQGTFVKVTEQLHSNNDRLLYFSYESSTTIANTCQQPFSFTLQDIINKPIEELISSIHNYYIYIIGVLKYLLTFNHSIQQIILSSNKSLICNNFKNTLPMGKGVSSSASICVLIVRIFNKCYNLGLSIDEEMDIAFLGERLVGSECGKLDQCCAYGPNVCLVVEFKTDSSVFISKVIQLLNVDSDNNSDNIVNENNNEKLSFLLIDLKAKKNTIKILKDLNQAFMLNALDLIKSQELIENATNYLLFENQLICDKALEFIERRDVKQLGKLLDEAQNLFDKNLQPLCKEELTAPILHSILNDEYVRTLIVGGKGVGSGGDGSCIVLCKSQEEREELKKYLNNNYGMNNNLDLTL